MLLLNEKVKVLNLIKSEKKKICQPRLLRIVVQDPIREGLHSHNFHYITILLLVADSLLCLNYKLNIITGVCAQGKK